MRVILAGFTTFVCTFFVSLVASANTPPTPTPTAIPIGTMIKFNCQWTQRTRVTGLPWTGDLNIRDNAEGLINGNYRSTSIRPDPFYGRIITVTGAAMSDNRIRLTFGISPNLTVQGEVVKGGIHGITSYNGGRLELACAVAPKQ